MRFPFLDKIYLEVNKLTAKQKWLAGTAFLFLLIYRWYFLLQIQEHVDEIYTFINFTHKGIWRSMSYYPVPNNHVFLSVITAAFFQFINSAFWALRLPAFLISLVVTVFVFLITKRFTSFWVAFLGIGLFCLSSPAILYSFYARGYFLLTGLSFMAAFGILGFVNHGKRISLFLLVLATVLGFYTIPVFLYPFVSIVFFGAIILFLKKNYRLLFELIITVFLAALLTILLYSPIFLASGFKAVIGNNYVAPINNTAFFNLFLPWLKGVGNTLVDREPDGFWLTIFIVFGLLSYIYFILKQKAREAFSDQRFLFALLLLCMELVPLVCVLIQRVLPPVRVWLYLSAFQFIGLAWILTEFFGRINRHRLLRIVASVFLFLYGIHQFRVLQHYRYVDYPINDNIPGFVKRMEQEKPKLIYVGQLYYDLYTQFAFAKKDWPVEIDNKDFDSTKPYEFVLFELKTRLPATFKRNEYREIYHDNFAIAYKKL